MAATSESERGAAESEGAALRRRHWLGSLIALAAAVLFSQITSFARLAYEAGATPLSLAVLRSIAFVLLVGFLLRLRGASLALPRRAFRATPGLALCMVMMSVGYLGSVLFIKVGLAVILLYTFPLMVAAFGALSGRERIGGRQALFLALAFLGLAVAVGGESFGNAAAAPDWRGIALALTAALGVALALAFGKAAMAGGDSRSINVWTHLWMIPLLLLLALSVDGGLPLPRSALGWTGFLLAAASYIAAYTAMFAALALLKPSQAALLFNVEPVFTLGAAALLLGEAISPTQSIGTAILLIAIGFSTLAATRKAV